MQVIFRSDTLCVTQQSTEADGLDVLKCELSDTITLEVLNSMWCKIEDYACDAHRFVVWIKHVDSDTLTPPSMMVMLDLCAKLITTDSISRKIRGCVVQGTVVDDVMRLARDTFVNLYNPRGGLECVCEDATARAYIDAVVKRRRCRASS